MFLAKFALVGREKRREMSKHRDPWASFKLRSVLVSLL